MKRLITCDDCAQNWRKAVGKYPGEHVKIAKGSALRDFRCDDCNDHLGKGSIVHAVSVYTDGTPYFQWEDGFISKAAGD